MAPPPDAGDLVPGAGDPAPGTPGAALVDRLRADLTAASFTVETLDGLLGKRAAAALARGHRAPAVRALAAADDQPAGTLARLFVLGLPTGREPLETALPTLGVAGATELGLVAPGTGDDVRPAVDLRPYAFTDTIGPGHWWIASDLGELALGHELPADHVLGVGGASLTLTGLLPAGRFRRALDLGTGCGIQALHVARHADAVVATDISRRALGFAGFNAALNGVSGIELRHGNLFEPVAGERFDLIVSNPPFVITPRSRGVPAYEYRDGGMAGDALVREVITAVARHLEPGGVARLLGNWEYHDGADGLDRVAGWLDDLTATGTALDAWVIERERQDPCEYAETWIRDGGTRPGVGFDDLYAHWLADFEARGVTGVGFGYLTLRLPRAGATLRRFERVSGGGAESGLGAHLDAAMTAHDWHAARTDAQLAGERLRVAPDVTEERHYWPGDADPAAITLRQGGGFCRELPVGTAIAGFVGACDGELTIGAICFALAALLEADEAAITAELLSEVRSLLENGILTPCPSRADP